MCLSHYIDVRNERLKQKIKNLTESSLRRFAGIVLSICMVYFVRYSANEINRLL